MIFGLSAGLSESMRLKMREKELSVFLDALVSLKSAAAYTAGDLYTLLELCRENAFLAQIGKEADIRAAWVKASDRFFTRRADRETATAFIQGYGKTDLAGQLAYIGLFETRVQAALQAARREAEAKCKLYTMLGLFSGTVTALILI